MKKTGFPEGENGLNLERMKILIIDDTPFNIETLNRILTKDRYAITEMREGKKCFEMVLSLQPDLILLSASFADVDSPVLCRQIKSESKTRHIPIILLVHRDDTESIMDGFAAGSSDYFPKPFREDEVRFKVRLHLQHQVLAKHLAAICRRCLSLRLPQALFGVEDENDKKQQMS